VAAQHDAVIAAIDASGGDTDAHATFRATLERAKAELHTFRITEEELRVWSDLLKNDPELAAAFLAASEEFKAQVATLPPIEVTSTSEGGETTTWTGSADDIVEFAGFAVPARALMLRFDGRPTDGYEVTPDGFAIDDDFPIVELWDLSDPIGYWMPDDETTYEQRNWMQQRLYWKIRNAISIEQDLDLLWDYWDHGNHYLHDSCQLHGIFKLSVKAMFSDGVATIGSFGCSYLYMNENFMNWSSEHRREQTLDHEFGHVLGLLHEHRRYDRDTYVNVIKTGTAWEKRDEKKKRRCFIRGKWKWCWDDHTTTHSTPYDYQSIMHYPSSSDSVTLKPSGRTWPVWKFNNWKWGSVNGATWYSPWDIYTIRKMYELTPNPEPNYTPKCDNPSWCPMYE